MGAPFDSQPTQPTEPVGRAATAAEANRVLEAARRGLGGFVLVTGESGIGKSTLASWLCHQASVGEMAVYWSACPSQVALAPAYWPWARLLQACLFRAKQAGQADLAELTRTISPVATTLGSEFAAPSTPSDATPTPVPDGQFSVFQAVLRFWTVAARARPALLVIEDLQWADPASIELLAFLAMELRQLPVAIIATLRTGEPVGDRESTALSTLDSCGPLVVQLRGLSSVALETLMSHAGLDTSVAMAELLYQRTAGNPYLASELVRMLDPEADRIAAFDTLATRIPDHVARVVRRRVAAQEPNLRGLLEAASVIGTTGCNAVLAVVADLNPDICLELIDAAVDCGLLTRVGTQRWRFGYTLLRDVVESSLSVAQRGRLRGQAAKGSAVGTESGLEGLRDDAGDILARAVELTQARSGADNALHQLLLGEACRSAGHTERARAAFRAAAETAGDDQDVLGAAALGLTDPLLGLDRPRGTADDDVLELLRRALHLLGDAETSIRVRLLARLSEESYFAGDGPESRLLADEAVAMADRVGDAAALAEAMAIRHGLHVVVRVPPDEALAQSAEIARIAERGGDPHARWLAHRLRLFDLLVVGDLAGFTTEMIALVRLTNLIGNLAAHRWWVALWQGMRALLGAWHAEADAYATAASRIANPAPGSEAGAGRLVQHVLLTRETSRLADLEPELREFTADIPYSPAIETLAAFHAAETGDLSGAADTLRRLAGQLDGMKDHRDWPGLWFQLSRVAYLVKDRESAALLYEPGQRLGGRCVLIGMAACVGAADLALAWLAETLGENEQAGRWYDSAEAVNIRVDARSWLAQTRVDHAGLLAGPGNQGNYPSTELAAKAADPAVPSLRLGTFRLDGGFWAVGYGDKTVRLPLAKGLADLHVLLSRPGDPIHVSELVSLRVGAAAVASGADDIFDHRARREIRQRLADLAEEAEEAEARSDLGRAEAARMRRAELVASLSSALGLGGRARRLNDPMERARKAVSGRIHTSIGRIEPIHPLLARHLQRSVDTGLWCVYRPEQPVTWRT